MRRKRQKEILRIKTKQPPAKPNKEIVMLSDNICLLVEEAGEKGVIDCGCSRTVSGLEWITRYLKKLNNYDEEQVSREESDVKFQFGGGETRTSVMKVGLPCMLGNTKVTIVTEVVDAEIPLLVGTNSLEKAGANLDFGEKKATFFGEEIDLIRTESGHYCIELFSENLATHINDEVERGEMLEEVLAADKVEMNYKQLQKLHHIFGHTSTNKLVTLIKRSGKFTKKIQGDLEHIRETCEACLKDQKKKPRPKCAIPRVDSFNQIVTIDLKEFDRQDPERKFICYLIDMHSRLTAAKFIPNKEPKQIIATIMEKWIGVGYGVMGGLHSDIGGEMCNEELEDVASVLDVKLTTTASYSPHQNGLNERNHAIMDTMIRRMLESDPTMSPDNALFWALNAKNSIQNCYGFCKFRPGKS